MEDVDLQKLLPKFAHRILLRDYLNVKCRSEQKQKLVSELKSKLKSYTTNKHRSEKQIFLGWAMYSEREMRYKLVREPSGGGIRKIYVQTNIPIKQYLLEKAPALFFPNGKCKGHKLENFDLDILNSHYEPVETGATLDVILTSTGLQRLRFYLATKRKYDRYFAEVCILCSELYKL